MAAPRKKRTTAKRRGPTPALEEGAIRLLLEHAHQSFLVLDREGAVVYANTEGAALFRALGGKPHRRPRALGTLREDVGLPLADAFDSALRGATTEVEREVLLEGAWRWLAFHVHSLPPARSGRIVITARDITDTRHLEILRHAAESGEREAAELYRLLAENSTDMISRHTPAGVYIWVSPSCHALLGWRPEELVGRSAYDLFHPDDLAVIRRSHETVTEQPVSTTITYRIARKDGSYTWFETSSRQVEGPDGVREIVADSRDVSARKAVEEERDRLFTYSVDLLSVMGYDGYIKQVNPAWSQALGWSEQELLSRPWMELVHPDDAAAAQAIHAELGKDRSIFTLENRLRRKDGSYLWVSWNAFSMRAEQLVFGVGRDVTARKELEERLRLLADHDGLTGAYNRRTWHELSDKELTRSRRHAFPLSVLMIDLDNFKMINDAHGHAAGDEVLKMIPRIFATVLRGHDIVGRIGGEEFAVTLAQCDPETAVRIAERLRAGAEATPVETAAGSIRFTLSVGVASLESEQTLQVLLERADKALYQAKRDGRNRVVRWVTSA